MRLVAPPCRPWRRLSPTKQNSGASSSSSSSPPRFRAFSKDSLLFQPPPPAPASSSSSASSRISPAVLFTIVILAVIFFVAGLLHLLIRFLLRKRGGGGGGGGGGSPAELPRSGTLQRQLQQLFHLHDAGLDQGFIDSLPLFLYREILHGSEREPFDCAVCLCEFAPDDKLRLLPVCGHAFHLACIDTWLLSNSTCPLCRGLILVHGAAIENPVFAFDDSMPENDDEEQEDFSAGCDGRMLPVRLGKFKKLSNGGINGDLEEENSITELGETSSSSLDARRCFSMGYYQYVVADANLQVALSGSAIHAGRRNLGNAAARGSNEVLKGKRLGIGCRDESLSVSKIWQWSEKKGTFPVSSADAALDARLPWTRSSGADT